MPESQGKAVGVNADMRRFLRKAGAFVAGGLAVLTVALLWLPNPAVKRTMLGSLEDRHAALAGAGTNRLIFVGGSNLGMGLDSARIATAFHRPVANTGISAGLGLRFMLRDAEHLARPGDIVVVAPEYEHFVSHLWLGDMELLAVVLDVCPETKSYLSFAQWARLTEYMPVYATAKIRNAALEAAGFPARAGDGCGRRDYNEYGDIRTPALISPGIIRRPKRTGREQVNPAVLAEIVQFKNALAARGVRVVFLPPVLQESAFDAQQEIIADIQTCLAAAGVPFLVPPARYRFDNRLSADTSYHLIRAGIHLRTTRVIEDLQTAIPDIAGNEQP